MTLTRLVTLACLLALLGACGHKAPPLPLLKKQPAAVRDLEIRQRGSALQLAWTIPDRNQDGSVLNGLAGFNLYRHDYDPQDDCPECIDTSTLLRRVELDYLQGAQRDGERIFTSDTGLEVGRGYRYRVVAVTGDGLEGAPAAIQQVLQPPTAAPGAFRATGHDRLVQLAWQAPQLEAGEELIGYNLYRGTGSEPLGPRPLNRETLTATGFDDFQVENGRSYRYGVRSLVRRDGQLIESPLGGPVAALPQAGQ